MPFPQRVVAISRAASATPEAPRPFADVVKDNLTLPALAALCRYYGLEVEGSHPPEMKVAQVGYLSRTRPTTAWKWDSALGDPTPLCNRMKAIARALGGCYGPSPSPGNCPAPLGDEFLDHISIPALTAVATRYGLELVADNY